MWNKNNTRRDSIEARRFSISEWNDAPSEEVTTYDAERSNSSNSAGGGEMNLDSIYDAINDDKGITKEGLFDSTKANPDVDTRRPSHDHGSPIKKWTKRATEVSYTIPSTNSDSLYTPTSNIWTRLLGGSDELWDRGDVYDDESEVSVLVEADGCAPVKDCTRVCFLESRHFCCTLGKYPYIVFSSALVFVFLLCGGMVAIRSERGRHIQQMKIVAECVARDTATWFADEFRRAMMPLYGVQQGVIHSRYFDTLNSEIGRYPQNVIESTVNTPMTKRNVTGICDNPTLQAKFRSIVEPINVENNLDGVVVGYRLFPNNVACLNEPSERSSQHFKIEDFPQGDMKGSAESTWGFDAGNSDNPFWKMVTEELFIKRELSIFGPFTLPPLKEAICGHLAIWVDFDESNPFENLLNVQGKEVAGAWGFVMNFLDWGKMMDRSGIHEKFASRGLEFELYRLSEPMMEGADRATLASSDRSFMLDAANSIIVETESMHGTWANKVGYADGWEPSWYPAAVAVVVLVSFLFAFLTASMLVERQLHRDLLYKVMPERAIKKLQRGQTVLEKYNLVTIFFSDIVGFTSMAGKMRPLQVMAMLNELYTEFDKIVEKHGVYKVETIGDAFMVVGGAPDRVPSPLAAERVALFALDAVNFVRDFRTKNGDQIFIRAGLASGPVCAGVVGKAMPRYCFFGDTVNFASRMESTSVKMKIQVSELTYRLLQDSPNMMFDFEKRRDGDRIGIEVKGKGHQITYWVKAAHKRGTFVKSIDDANEHEDIEAQYSPRAALSEVTEESADTPPKDISLINEELITPEEIYSALANEEWAFVGCSNPLVKATEDREVMITRFAALLEHYLLLVLQTRLPGSAISLSVKVQLMKFITHVADTYGDPNFHRLSHALHVTSSMNKLLMSLKNSDDNSAFDNFSLIFAAFLHDAGHTGMTNQMLKDKNHSLSQKYSPDMPIAERFAIEITYDILFGEEFKDLCDAVMPDDLSKLKFSKALFQSIIVTDIATPSRVKQCVQRYEAAKNNENCRPDLCPLAPHLSDIIALVVNEEKDIKKIYPEEFELTAANLQQCVRREHLMLVADIAHLLQCWNNFVKWNFRLYKEIHNNFSKGLCPDPSKGWFEGQIGFLEKYIIPLAVRSQIFFTPDFSNNLVTLGQANLADWKRFGVEASWIIVKGAEEQEDENTVLERLYALHS